jgi:hypothetical protein
VAFGAARRTGEFGIRLALGATTGRVVAMVLRESARFMVLGVIVGLPAALVVNRLMSARLFGIGTNDPLTIAGSVVAMAAVTSLAGYLPARRAARASIRWWRSGANDQTGSRGICLTRRWRCTYIIEAFGTYVPDAAMVARSPHRAIPHHRASALIVHRFENRADSVAHATSDHAYSERSATTGSTRIARCAGT